MSDRNDTPLLDEPALANDVVRLFGAEIQRLKRELHEAQQRATEAEARALVKREPSGSAQDLAAAERVQKLLEENTTLRTQYQVRYETEKGKRRALEAQIEELKSKETCSSIEESPAFLELQKHLTQTQKHLHEADAHVKTLLRQVEEMIGDKEANKKLLDEARGRIDSLSRNDPWAFISDLHQRHGNIGHTQLEPVMKDSNRLYEWLDTFLDNTLKPSGLGTNPFIYRSHDIQWSKDCPGYGIDVYPAHLYMPTQSKHEWVHTSLEVIDGTFELLYEIRGFWYYCGTYTSSLVESRNNARLFNSLRPQFKRYLEAETIRNADAVPPIFARTINDLYAQGILHVSCLVYERVGFNEQLNNALRGYGKVNNGPVYSFDVHAESIAKQRPEEVHMQMPPKVKRARVEYAQAEPSIPSSISGL